MKNIYKGIIEYLDSLKTEKEKQLESGDFSKVQSVAYGYDQDIRALEKVIDIVKSDAEKSN